jgi:hypothetical protein
VDVEEVHQRLHGAHAARRRLEAGLAGVAQRETVRSRELDALGRPSAGGQRAKRTAELRTDGEELVAIRLQLEALLDHLDQLIIALDAEEQRLAEQQRDEIAERPHRLAVAARSAVGDLTAESMDQRRRRLAAYVDLDGGDDHEIYGPPADPIGARAATARTPSSYSSSTPPATPSRGLTR